MLDNEDSLLTMAIKAEAMGIGAARVKVFLNSLPTSNLTARQTAMQLVEFAVDIRDNIREHDRTEPNAIEAEALLLISRAALHFARSGMEAPSICMLTKFEIQDYESLVALAKE